MVTAVRGKRVRGLQGHMVWVSSKRIPSKLARDFERAILRDAGDKPACLDCVFTLQTPPEDFLKASTMSGPADVFVCWYFLLSASTPSRSGPKFVQCDSLGSLGVTYLL